MSRADNPPATQSFAGLVGKNEDNTLFWSTPGVISVGNGIYVKRFKNEYHDNIHILRTSSKSGGTKFKFPSYFIPNVVFRLEAIFNKLELDANKKWTLPGYEKITSWDEFSSETFWSGEDEVRIFDFRIKPYLSSYGTLQFRMWNAVDEEFHKTFENKNGTYVWRGPMTSYGLEACKGLVSALKKLKDAEPET